MSDMPPDIRDENLTSVYRSAPADEPPAALDDAIRAAARRAAGARPRAAGPSFFARWQMPLSAAAVLVLCASLIVVMRDEGGELTRVPSADAPKPAAVADRAAEVASVVPKVELAPDTARSRNIGLKQPGGSANVPATGADAYSLASPGSAIGMRRAEPPTMTGIADSVSANRVADNGIQAKARRDAPVEVAQATAGGEQRGAMPASPAPALPASAGKLAAAAEAEKPMRQQAAAVEQMERDTRSANPSQAARLANPPAAEASRAESVAGTASARPAEKAAKEFSAAVEEMTRMPAGKWIARIEELRQAGRLEEARAGLVEFRRRFPDYVLPASLRDGILR